MGPAGQPISKGPSRSEMVSLWPFTHSKYSIVINLNCDGIFSRTATFGLVTFYRKGMGGSPSDVPLDNTVVTLGSSLGETVELWTELPPL